MTALNYCKVLIVDDEQLIRQGIKHFMNWEQEGFQIVGEASNGSEALSLIEELRPHIVITDIVMPVMDGEELTRIIKQRYPAIEVIILSSFGEFNYVRSTFQSGVADYILKPKLEMRHLLSVLKLAASKIPGLGEQQSEADGKLSVDSLLEKLLSGYNDEDSLSSVGHYFPHRYYALIGTKSVEGAGFVQAAQKIVAELIPDYVAHELPTGSECTTLLINTDESGLDKLLRQAKQSFRQAADSVADKAIVIGEPFDKLAMLHERYEGNLLKLMAYGFFLPEVPVFIYNDLPKLQASIEPFNLNRFTDEFKRERFDDAFDYLSGHVHALSANYRMNVFEFKSFLGNLIFNMTVLLGNMKYDNKELDNSKFTYFRAIEEAATAKEAIAALDWFIVLAKACIADKAEQPGNVNMKRLLDYIDEHYAEPLNLTEMAKHFHFNPSYLSNYFSTHNEEGFIDYLHKVRTDKAASLLRKGEAMISEISGMVGYSDHSYFCKVFKRHTGHSPSSYRRQYLK
ncbi:response regulator transcription factor [Paenibacillus harenae]|uniref:response regulator transcription factor n=1 Tax=Paenibacillus harenae TaxID=306543 RepID=UPI00278D56D1|nr:response regulator transcription factor [Paenibacillus harenae]MDQ0059205.1 two-component system response regulator YesN [Paenibacillus harenae]